MTSPHSRSLPAATAEIVTSLLREGLEVRLRLSGWSMKPLVRSGSMLRFEGCGEPAIGDVVLARLPNDALVAHRVVALDSDRVWTKGDACRVPDGPLARENILGRAVRLEGAVSLPLANVWMRSLGLVVNRLYPRLVVVYRALFPRCPQENAS
jgi:hypothetical protein